MGRESSLEQLKERLRISVRDNGLQWDDPLLEEIIREARREYSLCSGSLIGEVTVRATANGVCAVPSDYVAPERFIGTDGLDRPFYSWKYLRDQYGDFRNISGDYLRGLVFDFDGYGKMRLFPQIKAGEEAGKLIYHRLAKEDESCGFDALEQYALFQMNLQAGNQSAGEYYGAFVRLVNGEKSLRRGIGTRSSRRIGRFF